MEKGYKNTLSAIGNNLKRARLKKDLTQEELAYISKTAQWRISAIERGELNFGIVTLKKLAKALNISSSEILTF